MLLLIHVQTSLIARFMGPTWGPSGADRTQVGPMLAPWTLLSGIAKTMLVMHWGWVTHICVSKLTIIVSDNGLLPGRRQAIIWTNAGILSIGPLGTNFSEIWTQIQNFLLMKKHLKMSSAKWRPFCLSFNDLKRSQFWMIHWFHTHYHNYNLHMRLNVIELVPHGWF